MNLKCPKCGSSNVCEILYGMPTGEAYKLAEQGKMILGGCDIIIDDLPQPDYGCLDCKFEWAPELLSVDKQVKHIEKKEVQKLSSALRKELNVPVFARENSCPEKRFDLQISYTDGRKVNVTSTDERAICFLRLLDKVVKKVKMS